MADSARMQQLAFYQQALAASTPVERAQLEIEFLRRLIASGITITDAGVIDIDVAPLFPVGSLGGLDLSTLTAGDLLRATGASALARLAIGAADTVLASDGSAPAYGKIVDAYIDAAAAIVYSKLDLADSILDADINSAAAIAWSKISTTGSSLADLATRSASDLSSGTLPDARFPATLPAASGVNLTALNATQLTSGTVPDARFPATLPALNGSALTSLTAANMAGVVRVIDRDVVEAEVVNTTSETAVYSFSVPGGTLSTNRALRLSFVADYLNNDGAGRNLTVSIKLGSTTIFTSGAQSITNNASRYGIEGRCLISAANATNAQRAASRVLVAGAGSVTGTHVLAAAGWAATHNAIAEDSTGSLTLQVTVTHGTGSTSISFIMRTAQLELLSS